MKKMFSRTANKVIEVSVNAQKREDAVRRLQMMRYDANTIRCAEGFNTPLWQRAVLDELYA